jgi:hypothetical protein
MSETTYAETPAVDEAVVDDEALAPAGHACAACGAPVDDSDAFCNACGTPQQTAPPPAAKLVAQKHIRCESCGAEISTDPGQRSYVCPFCDSTYVVELPSGDSSRQPPEFVIGFAITPEQAQEKFRTWLAEGNWFRPGDLTQAQIEEKLRGVYLPFWSFSMLARSAWSSSIGEHWYRTETYTTMENGKMVTKTRQVQETEWWPLEGRHHRYYSGYLVSGSRGLPQQQAERIKPFQLPALKRFEPYYLAGWTNEEYSVDRAAALDRCQQEFHRREQQNVADFMPGDTHRNLHLTTEFSNVNSDLCLLPIYLLSYRYKEKVYRFLLNGQTGKTAGDKPLSRKKIGAAIGGILLMILIIVLMFVFLK